MAVAYTTAKDEMLAVISDSRPTPVFDELYRLVTEINDDGAGCYA